MADDYTDTLQPPQPTVVSGTGSAVQSAAIGDQKWQFDDEGGNWVNLETGEAVSPKVFSQMAGRSGNAAADTIALARAMQREEASLAPPRLRMPVMPPQAITTAPMPTAMTGTSPVVPPRAAIAPPSQFYPPEAVDRVRGQRSVPSTKLPPSDAAVTFYKMQQVQRLVDQGWKSADALKAIGLGQAPMIKPMTAGEQARIAQSEASLAEKRRQFDVLHPPTTSTESAKPAITKLDDRYSVVQVPGSRAWRLLDNKTGETKGFTPAQAAGLLTKITKEEQDTGTSQLSGMKNDLLKIVQTGVPSAAAGIAAPSGTRREVPMVGTVKGGYRFKGGDPSRKENWEKVQ